MANSRQIVALNVGSQRVSMGVFLKTPKNTLVLDRYASRLVVLDPAAEGIRMTKIGESIAELVQELGVNGSEVNYSISGQSVFIRFIKLPALDDTDIDQLIRFEAQQHVPFPLDEVVWDYHLLPANGLEREAILIAIKAEDLDSLNDTITAQGLTTGQIDCNITSLYNAFVASYPEETQPVMLIDIGAKSTDIVYSDNGNFFTRSISAGGIFLTSAIAREFNVPFLEAEEAKVRKGMVSLSNGQTEGMEPSRAALATVLRTGMTRLASEIQRTTNHYRAQIKGNAPVKAYLCGGGAALPYAKEFLQDKLGIPVDFLNPIRSIAIGAHVDPDAIAREAFLLAGLIGTALSTNGQAALNINLEPTAVAKQRTNKKKMPPIIAGAAVALLGAAAFCGLNYKGLTDARQQMAQLEPVSKQAQRETAQIKKIQLDIDALSDTVKAYKTITLQRYGYIDIVKRFLNESQHKSYPYWFIDFEPIAHFDPSKDTLSGNSIVKDSFSSDKTSSVADDTAETTDENTVYAANAIRVTGYAMVNQGGAKIIQELQKRIDSNPESLFTFKYTTNEGDKELEPRQYLSTIPAKDSKTDASSKIFAQFKLILPLKQPIPVKFTTK